MNEGVFSAWKGQRPLKLRPARCKGTVCWTTSTMLRRVLISLMTSLLSATLFRLSYLKMRVGAAVAAVHPNIVAARHCDHLQHLPAVDTPGGDDAALRVCSQ